MLINNEAATMWNERYKETGYFYGTEPNDFLKENYYNMTKNGDVLCIADGEGRNSVFLAGLGYHVTALDISEYGLEKAQNLAREKQVKLSTVCADINQYSLEEAHWDGIVVIFAHLPKAERLGMYNKICAALKPGGCVLMEVYSPDQLQFSTGGPKTEDLLPCLKEIKKAFARLNLVHLKDVRREIHEGKGHTGLSATVQLIGIKPIEFAAENR